MVLGPCLAPSGSGCARLSKIEVNSLGTMSLVLFFLENNLSFLLCVGVRYFFSNLVEHLTNLVMKAWSRLITTLHPASAVHDFTVGIGLGSGLGAISGVELGSGGARFPKVEENSLGTAVHDFTVGVGLDIDMAAGVELSKGIGVGKDCVDEWRKVDEFSKL